MKTQLFIRIPKNNTKEVSNPNFTLGLTDWNPTGGATASNGICYVGTDTISQDYTGTTNTKFKMSLNVSAPIDGSSLTGYLEASFGNWNTNISTIGQHTFYLTTSFTFLHDLLFTGQSGWNGGITNIQIETTELEYKELDLYDDIDIPITYNIADIKDITKRNSSYSKTITLPGTGHNNQILSHIYNLSTSGIDIINTPMFCYLLQDSYNIFEGTLEVLNCNINNEKEINYEAIVYSQTSNLYKIIGNKTLRGNENIKDDLDFSEYNHILTTNTIIDRQNDPVGSNVVYLPIDKQNRGYNPAGRIWKTDEFTPSIYIKEIWDKIFKKAGFTYTSTFLNSNFFKHLVYPHSDRWLRCTDAWALSKSFSGTEGPDKISLGIDPLVNTYPPHIATTQVQAGNAGLWTIVNNGSMLPYITATSSLDYGKFVVKESGYYNIDINYKYDVIMKSVLPFTGNWTLEGNGAGYQSNNYLLIQRDGSLLTSVLAQGITPASSTIFNLDMVNDTSESAEMNSISYNDTHFLQQGDILYTSHSLMIQHHWSDNTPPVWLWHSTNISYQINHYAQASGIVTLYVDNTLGLTAGDSITVHLYDPVYNYLDGTFTVLSTTSNKIFYIDTGYTLSFPITGYVQNNQIIDLAVTINTVPRTNNYFKVTATTQVTEGMLVQPTNILHKNIKQSDFITTIVKMFNLYMDSISDTEFIIEPRDDYYSLGTDIHDWTYKVSTNNTIVIEQPTDIIKSIIDFKYDYDEDFFSKAYKDANQREYGEYYKKQPKNIDDSINYDIKLVFATAPNAPMTQGSKMEIPKLFKFADSNGTVDENFEFKPRILYYKGIVNTYTPQGSQPEIFVYANQLNTQHLNVVGMFPYAGHFDDIYGYEQNDLLFGSNNWYWEITNPNWVTWNNLFNKYYYNMVQEYVDIDTRIVTMFIRLFPVDMENLHFYDLIYINGIYYRLNKIIDYTPGGLTKVELLKIKKQEIPVGGFVNPIPDYTNPHYTTIAVEQSVEYIELIQGGINAVDIPNDLIEIDIIDCNEFDPTNQISLQQNVGNQLIDVIDGSDILANEITVSLQEMQKYIWNTIVIQSTGGGTSSISYENRHDWVSPYDYCGYAVTGSLETDSVWIITRITVASDGSCSLTTLTNVKWSDRYIIF